MENRYFKATLEPVKNWSDEQRRIFDLYDKSGCVIRQGGSLIGGKWDGNCIWLIHMDGHSAVASFDGRDRPSEYFLFSGSRESVGFFVEKFNLKLHKAIQEKGPEDNYKRGD